MAMFRIITLFAFTAMTSSVYADEYPDYQAQQQASIEQFQQGVEMQNMENQMNSMDAAPPVYQVYETQPLTTDTAYGTMYVGPGSGFTQ